jgi:hypothetical protein
MPAGRNLRRISKSSGVSMAAKNQAILAGWRSAMVWVTLRTAASLKNGPGGRQAIYFESFFAASASAAC